MQTAGSSNTRARRGAKPALQRLGKTWQDRNWRVRLLGQLPPKTIASPPSDMWPRDRAHRAHQPDNGRQRHFSTSP